MTVWGFHCKIRVTRGHYEMDTYINKKCAVCGKADTYISDEYKIKFAEDDAPKSKCAKAFYKIWHKPVDECYNCGYIFEDISKVDERVKLFVGSARFKEMSNNEVLDSISEYDECNAFNHERYATICMVKGDDFGAAVGYLRAYFETLQHANEWKDESLQDGDDELKTQKVFDAAKNLAMAYLKKSCVFLDKMIKSNFRQADATLLSIYAEYHLGHKEKAKNLTFDAEKLKLTEDQSNAFEFVKKLAVEGTINMM